MSHFATIDAAGLVTGFYSQEMAPPGAFEISDETWAAWIIDTTGQRWNGSELEAYAAPLPPLTEAQARAQRDHALSATDWTQLPDAPLSIEQRAAYSAYRTALRALPQQPGFPAALTWPEPPA